MLRHPPGGKKAISYQFSFVSFFPQSITLTLRSHLGWIEVRATDSN
jgi:hypothetical protein